VYDLLLRNGTVVDGTGAPAFEADVAVEAGRIVALRRRDAPDAGPPDGGDGPGDAPARRVLDCTGRTVSPGWVDFHGHADWTCLEHPAGLNLLTQGCTLTVSGNCGLAPAPVSGPATELLRRGEGKGYHATTIDVLAGMYPRMEWSFGDFLTAVERSRPGVNFVQLAGHNRIRQSVMGHDARPATRRERERMGALLEECLDAGAFGMTSGLVYVPGCWAETDELVALASVVARRDGLYASHIRGERETNVEATQELVDTAERAGVRANVSHMQSKWPVYGNGALKVDMLEAARARGVDVSCDCEIYNMNSATLATFLQIYFFTPEQLVGELRSPAGRARLKRTMRETGPLHPLGRFGPGGVPYRRAWDRVIVWDCPHDRSMEGKSVAAVAVERGLEPEEALFDLTLAEEGRGPKLINDYIEDEHYRIVPWAQCIVPSIDTGLFDPAAALGPDDFRYQVSTGAPSTIGFAPRVLGQFVRDERLLTLEEGVRRMTSLPLSRLGITDRGVVRPGAWADLVVFDPATIAMRGPTPDPRRPETCWPTGISHVVVNGEVAMDGPRYTGARAGRVLRRGH
jgi:N-acyl-D-amino-acid deacylase